MYRGWTQTDYQNRHYNINQKDEGTLDDRRRDGGTNFILRIKEQETRLTLQKHDDDDDDVLCIPPLSLSLSLSLSLCLPSLTSGMTMLSEAHKFMSLCGSCQQIFILNGQMGDILYENCIQTTSGRDLMAFCRIRSDGN